MANEIKIEAKTSLYENTFKEIMRLKDLQWKIVAWAVAIFSGATYFISNIPDPLLPYFKIVNIIVLLFYIIAVYTIYFKISWHLDYISKIINKNYIIIRNLEEHEFGFYEYKWFPKFKEFSEHKEHHANWRYMILFMAIYSVIILCTKLF